LQYWGRNNTLQHWFAIGQRFGQKFFNIAFCSYLHLQFFNWAAVPWEDFQISQHRKAQSLVAMQIRQHENGGQTMRKSRLTILSCLTTFTPNKKSNYKLSSKLKFYASEIISQNFAWTTKHFKYGFTLWSSTIDLGNLINKTSP
jgi:hypothetical protein